MERRGSAEDRLEERNMRYNAVGCLVTLTLSLLTVPLTATAQPAKVWRIGYLVPAFIPRASLFESYRQLGYVDGQTAHFEIRTTQDNRVHFD
jgi:hypothetical protein